MNLSTYLQDIRYRMDDSPLQINPVLSDSLLINMLNTARRKISKEMKCYESQFFLFPDLHTDEYPIPSDYVELGTVLDVFKMQQYPPLNKGNAEITKTLLIEGEIAWYQNFFYVNEKRKTITYKTLPQYLEPGYKIKYDGTNTYFNRAGNYIIVNATTDLKGYGTLTSTGTTVTITGGYTTDLVAGATVTANSITRTIASITNTTTFVISGSAPAWVTQSFTWNPFTTSNINNWNRVKGYIKLNSALNGTTEYARYNEIDDNGDGTYTIRIAAWDVLNTFKNQVQAVGTSLLTNGSASVVGTSTKYTYDLTIGDTIYNGQTPIGTVLTITDDTHFTLNTTFTNTTTPAATLYVDNRYTFDNADADDTVRFASYVCNYWAYATPLKMYMDEDRLPEDVHDIVTVYTAAEAWMRRSRTDMANLEMQNYNTMQAKAKDALCEENAHIYNMGVGS